MVKIIPPSKKSNYIERIWHQVNERFTSPFILRAKLKESFSEQVPDACDYQVGYFEKRHNRKHWIEDADDLNYMYASYEAYDTIKLWCDGREEQSKSTSGKSHPEKQGENMPVNAKSKGKEGDKKQDKFESAVQELLDKHGDKYTEAQLRVWARLIVNGLHLDTDKPPDIPIITGEPTKKRRKLDPKQDESFTDVPKTAVTIFAEKFAPNQPAASPTSTSEPRAGISPASKAKLSSQYLSQLNVLQELRDKGVLSDEFGEQKRFALNNLRSLNK